MPMTAPENDSQTKAPYQTAGVVAAFVVVGSFIAVCLSVAIVAVNWAVDSF